MGGHVETGSRSAGEYAPPQQSNYGTATPVNSPAVELYTRVERRLALLEKYGVIMGRATRSSVCTGGRAKQKLRTVVRTTSRRHPSTAALFSKRRLRAFPLQATSSSSEEVWRLLLVTSMDHKRSPIPSVRVSGVQVKPDPHSPLVDSRTESCGQVEKEWNGRLDSAPLSVVRSLTHTDRPRDSRFLTIGTGRWPFS